MAEKTKAKKAEALMERKKKHWLMQLHRLKNNLEKVQL